MNRYSLKLLISIRHKGIISSLKNKIDSENLYFSFEFIISSFTVYKKWKDFYYSLRNATQIIYTNWRLLCSQYKTASVIFAFDIIDSMRYNEPFLFQTLTSILQLNINSLAWKHVFTVPAMLCFTIVRACTYSSGRSEH